jgi:hypothetical protein
LVSFPFLWAPFPFSRNFLAAGLINGGDGDICKKNRLQLKIYRSLGIEVETDGAGRYSKAVVRNNRKGDVHVINVDPKFSRFIYTNYLWDAI